MKAQRIIEMDKLGPLEVSADPFLVYWDGVRKHGWPGDSIRLLATLIQKPNHDPDDLAAEMGLTVFTLQQLVSKTRRFFNIAGAPMTISGKKDHECNRRVTSYNLEITA